MMHACTPARLQSMEAPWKSCGSCKGQKRRGKEGRNKAVLGLGLH